jgi:hypothetical protein
MEKTNFRKAFVPLFIFFLLVNSFCILFKDWLDDKHIDHVIVGLANCILFVLSLLIFFMHKRSLQSSNPNVFVRSVMASTIIKLLVIAGSALIYFLVAGENKSVYAVIAAMGLYVVYTIIEVKAVSRLNKENGRR